MARLRRLLRRLIEGNSESRLLEFACLAALLMLGCLIAGNFIADTARSFLQQAGAHQPVSSEREP